MTKHEAAIIQAYMGTVMLAGEDLRIFYDYVFKLLKHRIFTHEFLLYADRIKELSKPDFIELCMNLKEEDSE